MTKVYIIFGEERGSVGAGGSLIVKAVYSENMKQEAENYPKTDDFNKWDYWCEEHEVITKESNNGNT